MVCLRCGRSLKNLNSIKRGYGPACYKKIKLEHLKDNIEQAKELDEIDGQLSILDKVRKCS